MFTVDRQLYFNYAYVHLLLFDYVMLFSNRYTCIQYKQGRTVIKNLYTEYTTGKTIKYR